MTDPLDHFAVQPIQAGKVDKANVVNIDATSPLKAAETALGRPMSLEGTVDRACALVWRLTAGYVATSIVVYEPSGARGE